MLRSQLTSYGAHDPMWGFIALIGSERFTGEAIVGPEPKVHLYASDGRIYYAERDGDLAVGTQLVNCGALSAAQLADGTVDLGGVQSLARLFQRQPLVDRDAVELTIEQATESLLEQVANLPAGTVEVFPLRHHPAGLHHWLRSVAAAARVPAAPAVVTAPIAPEPEPQPVVVAEPEPVAVESEPEPFAVEPEPVAVESEPEPVAAEPEPVAVESEPDPVAVEAEPEPLVLAPLTLAPLTVATAPAPKPEPVVEEPEPMVSTLAPLTLQSLVAEPEPEPEAAPEEPVAEEPVFEAPAYEAPTYEAPAYEAPVIDEQVPADDAPGAAVPTLQAPLSAAPDPLLARLAPLPEGTPPLSGIAEVDDLPPLSSVAYLPAVEAPAAPAPSAPHLASAPSSMPTVSADAESPFTPVLSGDSVGLPKLATAPIGMEDLMAANSAAAATMPGQPHNLAAVEIWELVDQMLAAPVAAPTDTASDDDGRGRGRRRGRKG